MKEIFFEKVKISTFQLSKTFPKKNYERRKYQQILLIALVDFRDQITMTDKPICLPRETIKDGNSLLSPAR